MYNDSMEDGRKLKGQETKHKIIIATLKYISEHGLRSLSAQKIAKIAGVSKSNIFHHFETVENVPLESMTLISDEIVSSIDLNYDNMNDLLISIGYKTFSICEKDLDLYRAFFVLYNESFHDARYRQAIQKIINEFSKALKSAVIHIEGDCFDHRLDDLCQMVSVVLDGFGCHFLSDLNEEKYRSMWHLQVDMLVKELEAIKK